MLVSEFTRDALTYRKGARDLRAEGFIEVSENGDPLWKLKRGGWYDRRITDVRIGPDGQTLWIKVSE